MTKVAVITARGSGTGEAFATELGGIGVTGQNLRVDGGIARSV